MDMLADWQLLVGSIRLYKVVDNYSTFAFLRHDKCQTAPVGVGSVCGVADTKRLCKVERLIMASTD